MKATAINVDSVDWAAVARAYRLIRLSPLQGREKGTSSELRKRYSGWLLSRLGSVEFDIALRMVFEECMAAEHHQAHIGELLQETEAQNSLVAFKRRMAEKEKAEQKVIT